MINKMGKLADKLKPSLEVSGHVTAKRPYCYSKPHCCCRISLLVHHILQTDDKLKRRANIVSFYGNLRFATCAADSAESFVNSRHQTTLLDNLCYT